MLTNPQGTYGYLVLAIAVEARSFKVRDCDIYGVPLHAAAMALFHVDEDYQDR
jgi:hypothetical protein